MSELAARSTKTLALVLLAFAFTASGGTAATSGHGRFFSLVPHAGAVRSTTHAARPFAAPSFLTVDANYETLINQYLTDVAHDSGGTANVYSIATQYTDGAGALQYQSTFAGSYVDHDPLPANGCDDGLDAVCLTDEQIQAEIQSVLRTQGWHGSTTALFVLLTPNGVGGCFDSTSQECTTNTYCAYHNSFTSATGEPVIYANQPYGATIDGCGNDATGASPNNDDADAAINTLSHEHNEAMTDPFGDGWWRNSDGQENGDLCAWDFGTPIGGAALTRYNQVINGHHYWLQREWSNIGSGCFQNSTQQGGGSNPNKNLQYHGGLVMHSSTTYAIYWLPAPGNTAPPVISGTPAVNQTVASSVGSWNGAPTAYSYQWQRCSAAGAGCASIPGATGATYTLSTADGGQYVRSIVSAANVNGSSAYVASASQAIVPMPAATATPVLYGVAAVGKKLTTTAGSWNTAATFAYQWLRCASDGTGCAPISGATAVTYAPVAADEGHTLEAQVSATNVVGTVQALSNRTGVVVDLPRATKAPHISGRIHIGRTLSATTGSWSGPPHSYRYQWLRCNAHGRSCIRIKGAARATYGLARRDAGRRLRVRVTATNAAGSKAATSQPTASVPR